MIKIDSFLFKNTINYLHSSTANMLFDEKMNKLYLIDFEHTYLNEYFQQILYDYMFGARAMRTDKVSARDCFLEMLFERLLEFENFYRRKVTAFCLARIGLLRDKI